MKLIVGGACQGKWKFAQDLLKADRRRLRRAEAQTAGDGIGKEEREPENLAGVLAADGRWDSVEAAFTHPVVRHMEEYIRRFFLGETGQKEFEKFLSRLLKENPQVIVISNTLGCGIVPVKAEDRLWRDRAGEADQLLAKESVCVYRVICGLGQVLKGDEP